MPRDNGAKQRRESQRAPFVRFIHRGLLFSRCGVHGVIATREFIVPRGARVQQPFHLEEGPPPSVLNEPHAAAALEVGSVPTTPYWSQPPPPPQATTHNVKAKKNRISFPRTRRCIAPRPRSSSRKIARVAVYVPRQERGAGTGYALQKIHWPEGVPSSQQIAKLMEYLHAFE